MNNNNHSEKKYCWTTTMFGLSADYLEALESACAGHSDPLSSVQGYTAQGAAGGF